MDPHRFVTTFIPHHGFTSPIALLVVHGDVRRALVLFHLRVVLVRFSDGFRISRIDSTILDRIGLVFIEPLL